MWWPKAASRPTGIAAHVPRSGTITPRGRRIRVVSAATHRVSRGRTVPDGCLRAAPARPPRAAQVGAGSRAPGARACPRPPVERRVLADRLGPAALRLADAAERVDPRLRGRRSGGAALRRRAARAGTRAARAAEGEDAVRAALPLPHAARAGARHGALPRRLAPQSGARPRFGAWPRLTQRSSSRSAAEL